jgi:hypothetical protein
MVARREVGTTAPKAGACSMGSSTETRHGDRAELWQAVEPIFGTDDGSLPELSIPALSGEAVVAAFDCLRRDERRPFPATQYLWRRETRAEVPLAQVVHPAAEVVAGAADPFHCTLVDVGKSGVVVPEVGVGVFPDEITIDYRMGPSGTLRRWRRSWNDSSTAFPRTRPSSSGRPGRPMFANARRRRLTRTCKHCGCRSRSRRRPVHCAGHDQMRKPCRSKRTSRCCGTLRRRAPSA